MFEKFLPIPRHSLAYHQELDGLRGVAVLLVLFFHIYPAAFSFGYVGVDIFFVLSGYLITGIIINKIETGKFSFLEFYRNRIRRIFPAMLIVLIASLIAGYLFLFADEYANLAKHIKASALFFQNINLSREVGYWDIEGTQKPLLHFWSLSIEEQFYLFWPLLLLFVAKVKKSWEIKLFFLFVILFAISLFGLQDSFYGSFSRFWELALGGFAYSIKEKKIFEKIDTNFTFMLLIGAIALGIHNTHFSTLKTLVLIIVTALLLIELNKKQNALLSSKPLVFFGLISYPLYLWHYVIIGFLHIFGFDVGSLGIQIVIGSTLLSYLTFRFVEAKARANESYRFAFLLVVILLIAVAYANYTYKNGGEVFGKNVSQNEDELVKPESTDENGSLLTQAILGSQLKATHLKATDINRSKNYILLIGDSHAFMAYEGLSAKLKSKDYQLILASNDSCPTLQSVKSDDQKMRECIEGTTLLYKMIEKMRHVKKVIFVSRGIKYFTKHGFGAIDNEPNITQFHYFGDDGNVSDENKFYTYTQKTFSYFQKRDIKLYYVLENPELGFSPKECLQRPLIQPMHTPCAISREAFEQRQGKYRKKILSIASKYPNVTILDPAGVFCDRKYCYAMKNGKMLYADDDHLSLSGSHLQAKYFIDKIIDVKKTKE